MKKSFGTLPSGEETYLYTISCGSITASVSDYGASLVSLFVPDRNGHISDVVLGYDDCLGYAAGNACLGATVGRNANRTGGASFDLNGISYPLACNEGKNNLHSGPHFFHKRIWNVENCTDCAVKLTLHSPDGDQGFPGNACISVTYSLESDSSLHILYEGCCDQDTVFNMTNHSYFNLAGHQHTDLAVRQILMLPARFFNPDDAENIPTGELRPVEGTPMDFRTPKPICTDICAAYEPLQLQGGFDHNFEVFCNPCAVLKDPVSGRSMQIITDCPGIQFYSGNYLDEYGKGGIYYGKNGGIALETQFYPDALHHSDWPQPITKAGDIYHSETVYRFTW